MRGTRPAADPHPPSAGALGPPSPAVRERGSTVVGLQPRTAGEGAERSEPGEGSPVCSREK
jgi:hypothetical protein